jgi:N-acetylglutamate synthase-like GNAT family acetyltransferase
MAVDLLVKLYDLPPVDELIADLKREGIVIRRPRGYERKYVVRWVARHFPGGWVGECDVSFSHQPATTFLATKDGHIVGFACYEATNRNFFGPLGVLDDYRGTGIAAALTLRCLHAMAEMGYAYAIMGSAGDAAPIYKRWVGATEIAGSSPGIYVDKLHAFDDDPAS